MNKYFAAYFLSVWVAEYHAPKCFKDCLDVVGKNDSCTSRILTILIESELDGIELVENDRNCNICCSPLLNLSLSPFKNKRKFIESLNSE